MATWKIAAVQMDCRLGDPHHNLDGIRTKLRQARSEEHTSELQSLRHLVCRLLLEKKKKKRNKHYHKTKRKDNKKLKTQNHRQEKQRNVTKRYHVDKKIDRKDQTIKIHKRVRETHR